MENLRRLRRLETLNLSLNSIALVEGLESCESLVDLDLTLNFVGDLAASAKHLADNCPALARLTLLGNPCADYPGYRDFVVGLLPGLKELDGREVTRAERIEAVQKMKEITPGKTKLISTSTFKDE